eukprot:scaffold61146_cov40-Prasinocladus_malaysianus.AAC.1
MVGKKERSSGQRHPARRPNSDKEEILEVTPGMLKAGMSSPNHPSESLVVLTSKQRPLLPASGPPQPSLDETASGSLRVPTAKVANSHHFPKETSKEGVVGTASRPKARDSTHRRKKHSSTCWAKLYRLASQITKPPLCLHTHVQHSSSSDS